VFGIKVTLFAGSSRGRELKNDILQLGYKASQLDMEELFMGAPIGEQQFTFMIVTLCRKVLAAIDTFGPDGTVTDRLVPLLFCSATTSSNNLAIANVKW
jgi:hypothetical protein